MEYLRIRNWNAYQDTAGSGTEYVKLYSRILLDMEFMCLPDKERLCFLLMLAYAGVNSNRLTADPTLLKHLCHLGEEPDVQLMSNAGLIEPWCEEKHAEMIDKHKEKLKYWREKKREQRRVQQVSKVGQSEDMSNVPSDTETETETETETDNQNTLVGQKPNGTQKISSTDILAVIDFLNEKTGKGFMAKSPSGGLTSTGTSVKNLLKAGYTVQDMKTVIARKARDWLKDPQMVGYLRPKTLFSKSNFENYHGECV